MADTSVEQKPAIIEKWSLRERLCLVSSVMRSGDQNWASVSRFMKPFAEPDRPVDWFSQKNCALQYTDMMENSDLPKRKRNTDKAEGDSLEVLIVKKLTHERVDELKKQIKSDQLRYKTLRREIDQLKAGQLDNEVRTMWEGLQTKDREVSEEAVAEKVAVDNARPSSSGKNVQVRGGVKKPSPKLKNSQETESTSNNIVTSPVIAPPTAANALTDLLQKSQEVVTSPKDIDTVEIDVVSTTPQVTTPAPVSKPLPVPQDITPTPANDVSSRESSNGKNTDVGRARDTISMDAQQVAEKAGKGVPPPSIEAKDKKKVEANQHEKTSEKKREEKLDVSKVKKFEDLKPEKRKGDKFDAKMDKDEDNTVEKKVKKSLEQTIGKKDTSQENTDNHKEKKADVKYEPKKDKKEGKNEHKQEEKTSSKSTKASPAGKELHPVTEGEHTDSSKAMSKDGITKQAAVLETSKQDEMKQNKKVILKKPGNRKSGRGKRKSSDTQEDGNEKKDKSSDPSSIDDEKNEDKSETSEMEEIETRRSESDRDDQSIRGAAFCESMPNSPASITPSDDQDHSYRAWRKAIMLVWRAAASHKCANVFLNPVTDEIAPGYSSVVFRPMDLFTIKKHIESGEIRSTQEFQRDMMLMFNNAIMYNSSDHHVYLMAKNMQNDVMGHIEDFIATQIMVPQTESGKVLRARETPSRRDAADKSQSDGEHHQKKRRARLDNE